MQLRSSRIAAVGLAALTLGGVACSSSSKSSTSSSTTAQQTSLTLGGANFPEGTLLAYVYGDALKDAGIKVSIKPSLGARQTLEPGIQSGQIDMLVEYAASALEFVDNKAGLANGDIGNNVAHLSALLQPKGVTVLTPSSALDTNAFAVTKATAQKYSLTTMSDLAKVASKLSLGGPAECQTNAFCIPGLQKTYGITFKQLKTLDSDGPLTYQAVQNGNVDVAEVYSSDAQVAADNLVVLQDDKHLQSADYVVPIVRTDKATSAVTAVLNRVSAALTTDILTTLNKSVGVDKQDPQAVADAWLKAKGLDSSGSTTSTTA